MSDDLELLRRHEPILRFTQGENFLPMDVGTYVAHAALNVRLDDGTVREIVPAGELTLERLAAPIEAPAGRLFLRVAYERTAGEMAPLLGKPELQPAKFRRGPGRLTRVGYISRLVDAFFSLALLLRGRVPGALARDAIQRYRAMAGDATTHPYYGRVLREGGWIVLQYWYFYAFNDWRSSYHGANDHEADWEMVMVVLDEGADAAPLWAVYAQHDFSGPDLRRRWDHGDQLEVIDGHPVVNCGAGSHASYFVAGEYMTEQELALAAPLRGVITAFSRLTGSASSGREEKIVPIAFVDYARGEGEAIGPGQERTWEPVLVEEEAWARGYPGLWGAHVKDPFEGEDAPAGPMHARDGSPRGSFLDPLAFAALDTVPPPSLEPDLLRAQAAEIEGRRPALDKEIEALTARVATLGAEDRAVLATGGRALAGSDDNGDGEGPEETTARTELTARRQERAAGDARIAAIGARLDALGRGEVAPPGAHLGHFAMPTPPEARRFGSILEIWAALSIGLMLLLMVYVLIVLPQLGLIAALGVIGAFLFIDSVLRGTLPGAVSTVTLTLAVIATVILFFTFFAQVLVFVAIVASLFVIWQNLGEIR